MRGGVLGQVPLLFAVVKLAGAGYLVFLGVQAIRHRRRASASTAGEALPASHRRQVAEGFVVGVTNPKTIAFFVAGLPQFVDLDAGWAPVQMIERGLAFLVLALLSDGVWALVAAVARGWFARSPRRIQTLTAVGGVLIVALGPILLFTDWPA